LIQIEIGDCREVLKTLPDKLIHCCVTSPPYYGLRRYLPEDSNERALEIGTEQTPEEYVSNLVEVFREVKRVLRDDGQLWLNLGSSYVSKPMASTEMILRDDLSSTEKAYVLQELAKYV
jgi:site-specific DNA-methyltransferase (adenine-specific)